MSSMSISGSNFPSERISASDTTTNIPSKESYADASSQMEVSVQAPRNYANYEEVKTAEIQGEKISIGEQQLFKNIEQAVKAMRGRPTELQFDVHKQTHLVAVKVKDKETGEVLREIPPEKSLDFIAKLWEMAGLIVDEKR
ncbi:flagellar protein FlaG [Paenibacillus glycanilyticus]|uniref:flagellar protein FlaG n=1 Tax=Paenibacillus glycanilyticus TaxID=126569 RepID=UPI00203C08D9|nr:flagellar protein FlaG [Paenibacillus glycanilyticus]MCM3628113.1 flagellar protein FlaG [Paenibacillus glycanilyticus]